LKDFIIKSLEIMLVWVVDITWKSLLFYELDLLYNDNLIKCESALKNKKNFYFDGTFKIICYILNNVSLIG